MRTKGAKNVIPFGKRTTVDTSSSKQVRHLAEIKGAPLNEFLGLLNHQANFLVWVDGRHQTIVTLKKEIHQLKNVQQGKGPTGAKEGTFIKYRWYAEQQVLLDSINAFETFFKKTYVGLGVILQPYVQPDHERIIRINARQLWAITGETILPAMVPTLVFEQELFHDLDAIDRAADMLIGKRRYNKKTQNNPLAGRVKALGGIFQIRHTLSHNSGVVTDGDKAKFNDMDFTVVAKEVIDPAKNQLGMGIFKELEAEANDFTAWLASETASFLTVCVNERGLPVPATKRQELEALLGPFPCWANVPWS